MINLSASSETMAASDYDVMVVGGGSAGVVAAVQAARAGARTLLVEKSGILGGTTTLGGVNFPGLFHAWGRQIIAGVGWEWVTASVQEAGGDLPDISRWREGGHWRMQVRVNIPVHAAVADRLVSESGAHLRLHTMVARISDGGDDWQVELCGKEGLRSLRVGVLVDCTGDANIVGLAGFSVHRNKALQPGTLMMRAGGYELDQLNREVLDRAFAEAVEQGEMLRSDFQSAKNPASAFLFHQGGISMHVPGVDGSTSEGRTQAELRARESMLRIVRFFRRQPGLEGFKIEWCAPECGIRETVTIEGETRITGEDYVIGRAWPDSLCYSFYPIDVHNATGQGGIHQRHLDEGVIPTIPLGAQLPRGSRRLIAAGRCASGDQEANSAFRVQASAMAMGQVAGALAALAAMTGRDLREVPLAEARTLLRSHGAIVPEQSERIESSTVRWSNAPSGLLCDLLAHPEKTLIRTTEPTFGWEVNGGRPGEAQSAYQIRVGKLPGCLNGDNLQWDSGKISSSLSVNVSYAGALLKEGGTYWWTVRTWGKDQQPSPWACPQRFKIDPEIEPSGADQVSAYPLETTRVSPASMRMALEGVWSIDFGRQAFGWLELDIESQRDDAEIKVRMGEAWKNNAVDQHPPGSVRFAEVTLIARSGRHVYRVETPPDERNTGPLAIKLPPEFGVVLPFRYVEVEEGSTEVHLHHATQMRVQYPFNEEAASFASSNSELNEVWKLCHHTMMATTFSGYYVDGDRERIPYEADAYINQLGHYATDREFSLARRSHEYLLAHPTWPTEWKQHSILIAWADYEVTGDDRSLRRNYETLKNEKLLRRYARPDGLLVTGQLRHSRPGRSDAGDLVDWPRSERDEFDFRDVNTVVNAFHYRTLTLMERIARVLGFQEDTEQFSAERIRIFRSFNDTFFDPRRGVYVDGEGSDHVSQHGNLFPLAFGLTPPDRREALITYVKSREVSCSVYPVQYLLEGLFEVREAAHAIGLMIGDGLRSWRNMLRHDATLTWEAWDQSLKPNQDWNHAWGAAPANIIPRYVLGVRPLEPGFARVVIDPQLGPLSSARGVVPTIRGPIRVHAWRETDETRCEVEVPANVSVHYAPSVSPSAT